MKYYPFEHLENPVMSGSQNKCCGCDELEEVNEFETSPAHDETTDESEAEDKNHPPSTYVHVEIF